MERLEETARGLQLKEMLKKNLSQHHRGMFMELMQSGELEEFLNTRVRSVMEQDEAIRRQLEKEHPYPVTNNPLETAQHHNWIKHTAWEMVQDQILIPPSRG